MMGLLPATKAADCLLLGLPRAILVRTETNWYPIHFHPLTSRDNGVSCKAVGPYKNKTHRIYINKRLSHNKILAQVVEPLQLNQSEHDWPGLYPMIPWTNKTQSCKHWLIPETWTERDFEAFTAVGVKKYFPISFLHTWAPNDPCLDSLRDNSQRGSVDLINSLNGYSTI